jgi:GDPmannose 4,6-dehydratase
VPSALITGITGQDGYYLAELLLANGYEVHGLVRGQQNPKEDALRAALPDVRLHAGDLLDEVSLRNAFGKSSPDEVYNLAAVSFVQFSFANPLLTAEVSGVSVLRLLELIRQDPSIRFYQASTSEMFGLAAESPQRETTAFHPRSPYGVAKTFAHHATVNYRESFGLFCVSGILFNHESPRRGTEFVTRKITRGAAAIKLGLRDRLEVGNLDARRDWGFAGDYVKAMHLMLQQPEPSDFVVGTGVTHSVRELAETAFRCVGLDWRKHVASTEANLRPAEVPDLCAYPARAKALLGWRPTVNFEELIAMMVEADLKALERRP